PAFGSLRVGEGKFEAETLTLTNINELAALEFDAAYKGIVAKAVISTIIKTTAQAAINNQIDRDGGGGLVGALLKVGVGAAQYALTKADTRAWVNLPNTIQMAVVDRPKEGVLKIFSAAGSPLGAVEVAQNTNTLVLVKAAGTAGKPSIFTQRLPADTVVAGL
ncbi:MAG TPA: hypothetical protein VNQ97_16325, partial [Burkholderiaceae bacterium]|nr:hypothetical protein [Burkholderiaceae bacterium]